jgi:hypothetical protein
MRGYVAFGFADRAQPACQGEGGHLRERPLFTRVRGARHTERPNRRIKGWRSWPVNEDYKPGPLLTWTCQPLVPLPRNETKR